MSRFGRSDLRRLLQPHEPPCLSLFLPRLAHPPESGKDGVRLRNAVRAMERRLSEAGFAGVEALLEPLLDSAADLDSWSRPRQGLAAFRSPDHFARFALASALPERTVVADTFHVRPLLRFLEVNQRYFVLAVSRNRVRLFEGTPASLDPVELDELPGSLEEASPAEREPFLTFRRQGKGSGSTLFHGHGSAADASDEDVRRFFRAIDAAIWPVVRNEDVPLFVAGVARHLPLYREVSRYPHVAGHGVEGNADDLSPHELHERVVPLVRELFRERQRAALDELSGARGRGRAALDLSEIGRHAIEGRVQILLLGQDRHAWGSFDFETGRVDPGKVEGPLGDDILDDLAETVLVRGGDVLSLPAESMPAAAPVAAVLRW